MAIQYTDTPFTFTVQNVDLTSVTHPYVTYEQGYVKVVIDDPTIIDATHFTVILTQAQSGQFKEGSAEVNLNWFDSNGLRHATKPKPVTIERNLLNRVIHYE